MHASHKHSHSISSPIAYSFPSPAPLARPAYKTRRPSLTNTMSRFKDSLKERLHENVHAVHSHRRARSNGSRGNDGPYQPRGVIISEPRLTGSADSLPSSRLAPLGSGAIVVGTPQEALALSAQKGGYRAAQAAVSAPSHINQYNKQQPVPVEEEDSEYEDPPKSPPLPPLPASTPTSPIMQTRALQKRDWPQPRHSAESNASSQASGSRGLGPVLPDRRSQGSAKGRRGSPLAQPYQQLDDVPQVPPVDELKSEPEFSNVQDEGQPQRKSGTASSRPASNISSSGSASRVESDCFAAAPQLPIDLASALPQPPFEPVLMSNLHANMHKIDPGKLLVILETGDATVKSTLKTLTSRHSYLAVYLNELVMSTAISPSAQTPLPVDENGDGDGASMYSQRSEFEDSESEENYAGFNSLFQNHLTSKGIIKPRKSRRRADATSVIHIFLDRPSAPYAHIIAYLRAPILSSRSEGMLPYAARLFPAARHSFATARLEALLDLRDEASYLGLGNLLRLCDDELAGQVPLAADSGDAGRSSVHSTHTLCEPPSVAGSGVGTKGKESVGNSPPVHSVDIPVVLPTHESRAIPPASQLTKAAKTYSTDSNASTQSKRERRAGQVDLLTQTQPLRANKIVNASQLRAQERDRTKPAGNYF